MSWPFGSIPFHVVLALLPAFLLEILFYLALGFERLRNRLEFMPPAAFAAALTLAAAAPYTLAAIALGNFRWESLGWILALGAAVSFWYVLLPHKPATDILLLFVAALVMLTGVFKHLYPSPYGRLPLYVLGQLMWIRTGLFAMLSVRRVKGIGFGFWPSGGEWMIGLVHFLLFLPVAAALAWWIGFAHPHMPTDRWTKTSVIIVLRFLGFLWVTALGEEFLFRGLLQQWLSAWLKSEWGGLITASVLFGSIHLWYRGFPNWRLALLAAIAGVFYGLAFRRAKSIRASMVTHALVATTWKIFFSS